MSELQNELHRHYGLLLGVKSRWEVNLDMAARRVEIRLEWPTVRRQEHKELMAQGDETLKSTRQLTEGLNSKIQAIKSNARGFRSFENYRTRILFFCGKLSLHPL